MTTEPKAEGVEAVAMWRAPKHGGGWMYFDHEPTHMRDAQRLYTHPTPAAVEALAMAALELGDANFAEYCGEGTESMEPDDSKVSYPEERCSITFGMIRRIRAALAHPEIAALLKEKES